MINTYITKYIFPDDLDKADIPTHFKAYFKDMLLNENYRPISVLAVLFKIIECILNYQLQPYLDDILGILPNSFN